MKKKRILQIGAIVVAVLLLVLGLAIFYFPHWLHRKMEKAVHEESKGLYSLEISDVEASLFKKDLTLHGLALIPNVAEWQKQQQSNLPELTAMLSEFRAEKIRVNHLNYFGFVFDKPLELDSLTIFAPRFQVTQMRADSAKRKEEPVSFDGPLKDLRINSIRVENGEFSYKNNPQNKLNTAELKDLDLQINKLALDSTSSADPKRTFYAESIAATAGATDVLLPSGDHRLKMGVVSLGTKEREVKMKAIRLVPLYNTKELVQKKKKATLFLKVELPQLVFKDFDFSIYSRSGAIAIDSVLMDNLKVDAFTDGASPAGKEAKPLPADTAAPEPLYKTLEGPFLKMKINSIRIRNSDCSYKNDFQDKYNTASFKNFNLQVNKLQLDSASFFDPKRFFYTQAIAAKADSVDLLLKGGFYRLKTQSVAASTDSGDIRIRNLRVVPQYSAREMAIRKKRSTAWMKLKMPEIILEEVDFPAYSRSGNVAIGAVLIENPELLSFNDKKNFKEPPGEVKLFPQDLVQKLKFKLDIRKVEVRNMFARLDEINEKATRPGYMAFRKIYCTISNITNDKTKMSARNPAITHLHLQFKDKGSVRLTSRLNLLDPTCAHSLKGTFGKCDLQVFNSILEPSFAVRILSGTVQKGNFNLRLTKKAASGKMLLLYNNFKIELLANDGRSQSAGDKITSFFANAFVVEPDNPAEGNPPRNVDVVVTRKSTQSFISYWRSCLQTGFMTSVGLQKSKP